FFSMLLNDLSIFECFFFSSSRRHTRSKRDWSSDVCSSDLALDLNSFNIFLENRFFIKVECILDFSEQKGAWFPAALFNLPEMFEIGRASCRERVDLLEGEVVLEKIHKEVNAVYYVL